MPANRLLISMTVPMMISMLVQALYNIVDSMFVAKLNENTLTAVSLACPVQILMISVGAGAVINIILDPIMIFGLFGFLKMEVAGAALAYGMLSLWMFPVRQLCVLLPAAFILSKIGGLDALWWAIPFAEIFSLSLCLVFRKYIYKKEIEPLRCSQ